MDMHFGIVSWVTRRPRLLCQGLSPYQGATSIPMEKELSS